MACYRIEGQGFEIMSNSGIGSNSGVPSLTIDDKAKLKKALGEINDSLTRRAAENDLIKEIVGNLHDEILLDKKLIRRLAKAYYNSDFDITVQENKHFENVYEEVV